MFFKAWRSQNDIFTVALWLYLLSKTFGNWIFTVEFDIKRKPSIRLTIFDVIQSTILILFYGYCSKYTIQSTFNRNLFSSLEAVLSQMSQCTVILISFLCIILNFINRKHIWSAIVQLNAIDIEVYAMQRDNANHSMYEEKFITLADWSHRTQSKLHQTEESIHCHFLCDAHRNGAANELYIFQFEFLHTANHVNFDRILFDLHDFNGISFGAFHTIFLLFVVRKNKIRNG